MKKKPGKMPRNQPLRPMGFLTHLLYPWVLILQVTAIVHIIRRGPDTYPMQSDWVFASPTMRGKRPYWPDNLMKRYIWPDARANGHLQEHRLAQVPA